MALSQIGDSIDVRGGSMAVAPSQILVGQILLKIGQFGRPRYNVYFHYINID
jgi:hypothetical protein